MNKLQIALKECYETEYWIDMLQSADCFQADLAEDLLKESGVIRRMLVKAINTSKNN